MQLARTSFQPPGRGMAGAPLLLLATVALGCSIYANLSFSVTDPADYRYFPPFQPYLNLNMNDHLGAEYFNIAQSLRAGEGFSNPFGEKTGPTAWMPPIFPVILATLLWACGDDKAVLMIVVVCIQYVALILTGVLVLILARQTTRHLWATAAAALFILSFIVDFFLWFQFTHDSWLVLLALDVVLAGLCWLRPLGTSARGAGWGIFGGFCALINPVVGFTWAALTTLQAVRKKAWSPLAVAGLCSVIVVTPWLIRNYLVFGAWIPVKSNLAYELFQSQCLEPVGLVHSTSFINHPFTAPGKERTAYKEHGEIAFMDQKGKLFRQAALDNPEDYVRRVGNRLVAATFWYEPFWPTEAELMPEWVSFRRVVHPLPILALLFLVVTSFWQPLPMSHRLIMSAYAIYLLPFIAITYYDRYAVPLLAAKVLLVVWSADRILSWMIRPARPTSAGGLIEEASLRVTRNAIEVPVDAVAAVASR